MQNILHGLSPSLCAAVQSVSRWRLVQAAFPHVVHCCAAVLRQRQPGLPLGGATVKLLYTLHWLVLDAAAECDDTESGRGGAGGRAGGGAGAGAYVYTLDAVELFVYMLAPLMQSVHTADLQTLKLENGLRMWHPLWSHRQPDVACFSSPVQSGRTPPHTPRPRVNFNMADIYIGRGMSVDDFQAVAPPGEGGGSSCGEGSPRAPLARLSDICALSASETATSVEVLCEACSAPLLTAQCPCVAKRFSFAPVDAPDDRQSPVDRDYVQRSLASSVGGLDATDSLSASYFDVAVLRCLFCPRWHPDGVLWALRYLHVRLLEVKSCDEYRPTAARPRSRSLPLLTPARHAKRPRVAQLKQSTRQLDRDDDDSADDDSSSSDVVRHRRGSLRKPTITVTGDTPTRAAVTPDWSRQLQSATTRPVRSLRRVASDSRISYKVTGPTDEVAGSIFYIRPSGQLDYEVVLQGVAGVASHVTGIQPTAVLLNLLNCLLDLGVGREEPAASWAKGARRPRREKSCHHMAMDTVIR